MFRESFVPCALQLLFEMRIIHLTGVRSSPVVHLLSKYLKRLSDLSKSSVAYCSWFSLPACIRINSICLAIFFKILCDCRSVPMDSACVRILAIINQSLEIFFPAQTFFQIWASSCPIQIWSGTPLSLFNLLIFWSEPLLLILRLEIIIPLYPSIESFRRFYKPIPLHPFFIWLITDTHINSIVNRQIHFWVVIRQWPSHPKSCEFFPDT